MAFTTIEYTYTGQPSFPVPFPLGILSREYVTVRVNNAVDGAGDPLYYTDLTWLSDSELEINGLSIGDTVLIVRTVPKTELVSTFVQGADITRVNLDNQSKQLIMAQQEILDGRYGTDLNAIENALRAEAAAEEAVVSLALVASVAENFGVDDTAGLRLVTSDGPIVLSDGSIWTTDGTTGFTGGDDNDVTKVVDGLTRQWVRKAYRLQAGWFGIKEGLTLADATTRAQTLLDFSAANSLPDIDWEDLELTFKDLRYTGSFRFHNVGKWSSPFNDANFLGQSASLLRPSDSLTEPVEFIEIKSRFHVDGGYTSGTPLTNMSRGVDFWAKTIKLEDVHISNWGGKTVTASPALKDRTNMAFKCRGYDRLVTGEISSELTPLVEVFVAQSRYAGSRTFIQSNLSIAGGPSSLTPLTVLTNGTCEIGTLVSAGPQGTSLMNILAKDVTVRHLKLTDAINTAETGGSSAFDTNEAAIFQPDSLTILHYEVDNAFRYCLRVNARRIFLNGGHAAGGLRGIAIEPYVNTSGHATLDPDGFWLTGPAQDITAVIHNYHSKAHTSDASTSNAAVFVFGSLTYPTAKVHLELVNPLIDGEDLMENGIYVRDAPDTSIRIVGGEIKNVETPTLIDGGAETVVFDGVSFDVSATATSVLCAENGQVNLVSFRECLQPDGNIVPLVEYGADGSIGYLKSTGERNTDIAGGQYEIDATLSNFDNAGGPLANYIAKREGEGYVITLETPGTDVAGELRSTYGRPITAGQVATVTVNYELFTGEATTATPFRIYCESYNTSDVKVAENFTAMTQVKNHGVLTSSASRTVAQDGFVRFRLVQIAALVGHDNLKAISFSVSVADP